MPPPVPDRTETLAPRSKDATAQSATAPLRASATTLIPADDPERYEQVCEHARGGLGRVVRAIDKRLGRTVAVKELLRRGSSAGDEARFLREALITARLEHPGIVPVHEAGRWPNGDPYYVMKLVEGRTLKELIATRSTLRDRLHLLPHAIAIADAVGYAHSQGVIHRDLKPSNVLVGEFGETIVVDWGLARAKSVSAQSAGDRAGRVRAIEERDLPEPTDDMIVAAGSGASTVSGKVVGTPAYMSPEQARGELVDERADVYAIGAVLYELLTGQPPHHDETPQATLDRVIAGPPRPVVIAAPHVPSELATIVGKAMARCPDDRYTNATALAEDLRRFQTGKLVSAHSYTAWSLLRKKVAQHRGVVAVAIASTVALAVVGVESFRRVVAERNIAQHNDAEAQNARTQAEKRQRELVLLQSMTALRKDPTATLAWLKTYEVADGDRAQVQDLIDEASALGVSRHVFRTGAWVFDVAFTPDNKRLVAAVRDGSVRVYDLATGTETILGRIDSAPETLALAHDGSFAITGSTLGSVTKWPLFGGPPKTLAKGGPWIKDLELSSDGKRVLVIREAGAPEVLPIDGSEEPTPLGPKAVHRTAIASSDWTRQVVATSPNQIAAVEPDGQVRPLAQISKMISRLVMSPHGDLVIVSDGSALWSVPFAGGPLKKLVDYPFKLVQVVWSPDGKTVAVGGDKHDVVLVDLDTGLSRELRGHTDAIYTVQWTRDGRRLLSASDDGTARVWTVADGTAQVLRGHDDDVYRARFSHDERQVTTASLDGSARVWQIEQPGSRVLVEGDTIEHMVLDGDRALIATKSEVVRWNVASGHREPVFSWAADATGLGHAMASPDGTRLIVPGADWSLEVRRLDGPSRVLRGHRTVVSHIEFSRDSRLVFTSSFDGTLRRWDLDTGAMTILIEGSVPVKGFAVARDGRIAVQVGDAGKLITPEGKVSDLGATTCVAYAEFERMRDRLLMRRCDLSLVMLDGDRLIDLPTGGHHVSRVASSADGKRLAGAMADRTVRLWDAETGKVLRVLRGHSDLVMDVEFSPNGTLLASASYDKTVRVWDLVTERQRVLRGHQLSVNRVAWRGDSHLVTSSRDGTIRVWDAPLIDLPTREDLAGRLAAATTARIDVDRPTTAERPPRGI